MTQGFQVWSFGFTLDYKTVSGFTLFDPLKDLKSQTGNCSALIFYLKMKKVR